MTVAEPILSGQTMFVYAGHEVRGSKSDFNNRGPRTISGDGPRSHPNRRNARVGITRILCEMVGPGFPLCGGGFRRAYAFGCAQNSLNFCFG